MFGEAIAYLLVMAFGKAVMKGKKGKHRTGVRRKKGAGPGVRARPHLK